MKLKISQFKPERLNEKHEIKIFSFGKSDMNHPLAESTVSAGFPAYAENFKTEAISIDKYLIHRPESSFIIQVSGESMLDAGIFPNSYIVVDCSLPPLDNRVVVARLEDEFLVKRLRIFEGYALLKAENAVHSFPDIRIDDSVDFEIWGTVTGTFRRL